MLLVIDFSDAKAKEVQEEEDRRFSDEVEKIIDDLVKNTDGNEVHTFPPDLNARKRRIVHEIAEKRAIFHLSQGNQVKRFISISIRPIESSIEPSIVVKSLGEVETKGETNNDVVVKQNDLVDNLPVDFSIKNNFEILEDKTMNTSQSKSEKEFVFILNLYKNIVLFNLIS